MDGEASRMKGRWRALAAATLAFLVAFVAWGAIAPLVPYFRRLYELTPSQAGLLVSAPIFLGALGRIPIGLLADRHGGRKVFTVLLLALAAPALLMALSRSYLSLLGGGLLLGLAGTSFAVGVPFVTRWFPPERLGFALGVYGMGNLGSAVASLAVPRVADAVGWPMVFVGLAPLLALTGAAFWLLARDAPGAAPARAAGYGVLRRQPLAWILALFYFVTFGGFVALGAYLPTYLVTQFRLDWTDAAARAGGFLLLATLVRPLGGALADRRGGVWVLNRAFAGVAALAIVLALEPGLRVLTAAVLGIAVLLGAGNGAVFKLVGERFPREAGVVGGLVGAAGALGGFFPPLVMGSVRELTGSYSVGFMLLSEAALVCVVINLLLLRAAVPTGRRVTRG